MSLSTFIKQIQLQFYLTFERFWKGIKTVFFVIISFSTTKLYSLFPFLFIILLSFCCFFYFYNPIFVFADDTIDDSTFNSTFDSIESPDSSQKNSTILCFYNTNINKFLYDYDFTFKQYISILNKFPMGVLNSYGFAYEHINNLSRNWSVLQLNSTELVKQLYNGRLSSRTLDYFWQIILDTMRFEKTIRFIYNPTKLFIWIQSYSLDTSQIMGFSNKNDVYIFLNTSFKRIYTDELTNITKLDCLKDISIEQIKKKNFLENLQLFNMIIFEISTIYNSMSQDDYDVFNSSLILNRQNIFNCVFGTDRYVSRDQALMRTFIFLDTSRHIALDSGEFCNCKDLAPAEWDWLQEDNVPDNISVSWYDFNMYVEDKLNNMFTLPLSLPDKKCVFDIWRFAALMGETNRESNYIELSSREFISDGYASNPVIVSSFFKNSVSLETNNVLDFVNKHSNVITERHILLNKVQNIKLKKNVIIEIPLEDKIFSTFLTSDCFTSEDSSFFLDEMQDFIKNSIFKND